MSIKSSGSPARTTGARQTMMTWAKRIDSFEELPEAYKIPLRSLAAEGSAFPYAVLAPPQEGAFETPSPERLLCEVGDTFYALEREGGQVLTRAFPYPEIRSLEIGNIFLYSWFHIHGRGPEGSETALKVKFNEATLRHFTPFFARMRPAASAPLPAEVKATGALLERLAKENFKLANLARQNLVAGERVLQAIYQPAHRQSLINLPGRDFSRTISLAHLTVLTDKEVILVGDAERISEKKRNRYGGVQRYLPLRGLVSVDLEERPEKLLALVFVVSADVRVERLFDANRLREVEAVKGALLPLLG